MANNRWAIGVDLGGTKVEVAQIDSTGRIHKRVKRPTEVKDGPSAVKAEIIAAVQEVQRDRKSPPIGVGVGVAGQIDAETGAVRFAPNLHWRDVPLQDDLRQALGLPVVVVNDVRAATWAEYLHGAGKGCDDLICLFVGTGVGGGVISGGKMLAGCSNSAGELGHMTIQLHGPLCHCGNHGCLEALTGGWAIARQAQQAIEQDPHAGAPLLERSGGLIDAVTAQIVVQAALDSDPLARRLMNQVTEALIAGAVSLANAFNPCRLVLGGGIIEGMPELVDQIDRGVRDRALEAASSALRVYRAQLHNDAGVVGAAALAMQRNEN